MAGNELIDGKYLKGLKFRTAEERTVEEDGRKKKKSIPVERALKPEDVLSWSDQGTAVVIVSGDGQKRRVEKEPEPKKGKEVKPDQKGGGDNA